MPPLPPARTAHPAAAHAHSEQHDHPQQHSHHEGCGHSRVAHHSKRWAELHSESVRQARALGVELGPPPGGSYPIEALGHHSLHTLPAASMASAGDGAVSSRALLADGASKATNSSKTGIPIRIWVEYQGIDGLPEADKKKLKDTVNVGLGVLQKYLMVRVAGGWRGC